MATPIPMPRQGNTVESCTIVEWHKNKGDSVAEGDVLFTYETDKATFEMESPVAGTLLETFFSTDEDIPVLTTVAVIGNEGEEVESFRPSSQGSEEPPKETAAEPAPSGKTQSAPTTQAPAAPVVSGGESAAVSPRARNLAAAKGVNAAALAGTGPKGRVIERDVLAAAESGAVMTRAASAAVGQGTGSVPAEGTGIGGRIRLSDLTSAPAGSVAAAGTGATLTDEVTEIKMPKMRAIIADKMMGSLMQAAQLTMTASAKATQLMNYRKSVKAQGESLGLNNITINDLVAFAATRVLPRFPEVNSTVAGDTITQYKNVHLAMAVDTARGLMVPVVRYANLISLNDLAAALKSSATQCQEGSINPDALSGGTITISNLGAFGIESFTPIINPPQVAILGVNTITQKPVQAEEGITLVPHIGLSLTIDHRALDGAPAARFLKALVQAIENFNLTLSL